MKLKEAKELYLQAKKAYYDGTPIMSDQKFDALEDKIKAVAPDWIELQKTGVALGKRDVTLPFFMPSLNKCYEDIDSWFDKYPRHTWVYMAKLDGNSVMLEYENGKPKSLYTRGNGTVGKDISYFLPKLSIPQNIAYKKRLTFRCEAIVSKTVFAEKWQSEFDNARNMVAGILNRKAFHDALADVSLVVLGVYGMPLLKGLQFAFKQGFETVFFKEDRPRKHAYYLEQVKQRSYEADGVVIANPDWLYSYENADKPKRDIIAYKENVELVQSEVVDVIYQISSAGRITPKIQIKPVQLAGATIQYCTAHNAQWMLDRKLGIGSIVRVCRSGDVIPKIVDVESAGQIVYPTCEYKQVGVNFVATNCGKEQTVQMFVKLFATLEIDAIREGTLNELYDCGIKSLDILLKACHSPKIQQGLLSHFGGKKGQTIYNGLRKLVETPWPIARLMVALSIFDPGVGIKRLESLQQQEFDLLALSKWKESDIASAIVSPGIGESLAPLIAHGLKDFETFYNKNRKYLAKPICKLENKVKQNRLNGLAVSFTGYRDKQQEELIEQLGGRVVSFGKQTDVLLYSATGKASSKVAKAGDKAMTFEQFKERYL